MSDCVQNISNVIIEIQTYIDQTGIGPAKIDEEQEEEYKDDTIILSES